MEVGLKVDKGGAMTASGTGEFDQFGQREAGRGVRDTCSLFDFKIMYTLQSTCYAPVTHYPALKFFILLASPACVSSNNIPSQCIFRRFQPMIHAIPSSKCAV